MATSAEDNNKGVIVAAANAVADDIMEVARADFGPETGWEHYHTKNEIRVERNKRTALHKWRAFGHIDAPLHAVLNAAAKTDARPAWDPMCSYAKVIEKVSEVPFDTTASDARLPAESGLATIYTCVQWEFKGVLNIVSPRDLCMAFVQRREAPGLWVSVSRSMSHPNCPPRPGCVRGDGIIAGLVMKEASDGRGGTDITYVAQVDPKGWLPTFAVNLGSGKGAQCIKYLQKFVLEGRRAEIEHDQD